MLSKKRTSAKKKNSSTKTKVQTRRSSRLKKAREEKSNRLTAELQQTIQRLETVGKKKRKEKSNAHDIKEYVYPRRVHIDESAQMSEREMMDKGKRALLSFMSSEYEFKGFNIYNAPQIKAILTTYYEL